MVHFLQLSAVLEVARAAADLLGDGQARLVAAHDDRSRQDAGEQHDGDEQDDACRRVVAVAVIREQATEPLLHAVERRAEALNRVVGVVGLRERVPAGNTKVRERLVAREGDPRLDRDEDARADERHDDHDVDEVHHDAEHRSRQIARAHGDVADDDRVDEGEAGSRLDGAAPGQQADPAADGLRLRPDVPDVAGVEETDDEIEP